MTPLAAVVASLAARPGARGAVLASADGLVLAAAGAVAAEDVAALVPRAARAIADLGAPDAALRVVIAEFEAIAWLVALLAGGTTLAVAADPAADLGLVLRDLRRHAAASVALL